MIDIRVRTTPKGLRIEFINLSSKPLLQDLNTDFILSQLEDPIFLKSNKTIKDLIPLHYTFLNNRYDLNQQQVDDIDNWFNQPVDELLKYLDEEALELVDLIKTTTW
jgi:hypothetical protein